MNHERIAQCIVMLQTVNEDNFNMEHFNCGTAACFAGHLAADPSFRATGGSATQTGAPLYNGVDCEGAVAQYLGISNRLASCIVLDQDPERPFGYSFWRDEIGIPFEQVRPGHVIDILERTMQGEFT